MKKGLVVIYDPHNLYQFLWYYSSYGKNIEWEVLCLPNSHMGEYLSGTCEKIGIFKKVHRDTQVFDSMPLKNKLVLFFKMMLYALVGQQKMFAKKFLGKYVNTEEYDEFVILTDVGFVSGLFLTFAKEKKVVILEDGIGDYLVRKYSNFFRHCHNFFDNQGFVLSLLGYSNTGHVYPLRTTKNCIKFSSHPEKMYYKKYKEFKLLFDQDKTDITLFNEKVEILYPAIKEYFCEKYDIVLFTTPSIDFTKNNQKYTKLVECFINNTGCRSLLIKKHPRDKEIYNFADEIKVTEIPQSIPGEVMMPYLKDIEIYFMDISSINLYMSSYKYNPKFFYFKDLRKDNLEEKNILGTYPNKSEFLEKLSFFNLDKNVIEL